MSRFTPGDHPETARPGYTHHGLYVGSDLAIHYRGPNHGLPGEIVMTLWMRFSMVSRFGAILSCQAVRPSREHWNVHIHGWGEHRYDVLFSNRGTSVMCASTVSTTHRRSAKVAAAVAKSALRTQQTTIMPPAMTVVDPNAHLIA